MTDTIESLPQPTRRPNRRRTFALGMLITLAIAGLAAIGAFRDEIFGSPADPGTPQPASAALTGSELEFYDFLAPRLRALAAECEALTQLGRERSRNLIELQRRGNRVESFGEEIDTHLAQGLVPTIFESAVTRYSAGIGAVRKAISDTRTAFSRFDWDGVALAVKLMERGSNNLAQAVEELETAAGQPVSATPLAGMSSTWQVAPVDEWARAGHDRFIGQAYSV